MNVEELKINECRAILKQKRLGRIACSRNNQPYIVPINFVFDGKRYIYAFSAGGQKIECMRENPLVCIEVDDIRNQNNWTTVIIFGHYQELPDTPEFEDSRIHAHELLSKYPMWWQSAYVSENHHDPLIDKPVYFRIRIKKIIGHRSVAEEQEIYVEPAKSGHSQRNRFWGVW